MAGSEDGVYLVAVMLGSAIGAMVDPVLLGGSIAAALLQPRWRYAALGAAIYTPIYLALGMAFGSGLRPPQMIGVAIAAQAWAAMAWLVMNGFRRARASPGATPNEEP